MIGKEYAMDIATRLASKRVEVEPYFGPVADCMQIVPNTYTGSGVGLPLTAMDFSEFWSVNTSFQIGQAARPFLGQFEVWRVPSGSQFNTTNCAGIPSEYRGINQTWPIAQNSSLIGGKYIAFVPKGATLTSTVGSVSLNIRAYFYCLRQTYNLVARFMYVSPYVYVGKVYFSMPVTQREGANGQLAYPAFVNRDDNKFFIYGLDVGSNVTTSDRLVGTGSTEGVFNGFSQESMLQYFTSLLPADDVLLVEDSFPPYFAGYRFKYLDVDGSPSPYLTQAVAP